MKRKTKIIVLGLVAVLTISLTFTACISLRLYNQKELEANKNNYVEGVDWKPNDIVDNGLETIGKKYDSTPDWFESEDRVLEYWNEVTLFLEEQVKDGNVTEWEVNDSGCCISLSNGSLHIMLWSNIFREQEDTLREDEASTGIATNMGFQDKIATTGTDKLSLYGTPLSSNSSAKGIAVLHPYYTSTKNRDPFGSANINILEKRANAIESKNSEYAVRANLKDGNVSIEFMQTLNEYRIVTIESHGGFFEKTGFVLCLLLSFDDLTNNPKYTDDIVSHDNSPQRIARSDNGAVALTEEFFRHYYQGKQFDDTLIYLGTCKSAVSNSFFEILKPHGVKAILGYDNNISVWHRDIYGTTFETLSNGFTLQESLDSAKEKHGSSDSWNTAVRNAVGWIIGAERRTPAKPIIFGDKEWSIDKVYIPEVDASEPELKKILEQKTSDSIIFFEYGDYDANGINEAFAVTGYEQEGGFFNKCTFWFVSKSSGATEMVKDTYGSIRSTVKADKYSFFVWERHAGGSAGLSFVYGVKDGKPYELLISQEVDEFKQNENGKYQSIDHDLSKGYHDFITRYFYFDKAKREFFAEPIKREPTSIFSTTAPSFPNTTKPRRTETNPTITTPPEKRYSWEGTWEVTGGWKTVRLTQNGNSVTGSYTWKGGKISGTVSGNTLKGTWKQSEDSKSGTFEFTMSSDGKRFDVKWWYAGDSKTNVGEAGTRITPVIETAYYFQYASRVVKFTPGSPYTTDTRSMNQNVVLGSPNYVFDSDKSDLTLGIGGVLIIEFEKPFQARGGDEVTIFETSLAEPTKIEISNDLKNWILIGTASDNISSLDIQGKVKSSDKFKYIRITDIGNVIGEWPGADIDAVGVKMHK